MTQDEISLPGNFLQNYATDEVSSGLVDFLIGRKVTVPADGDLGNVGVATLALYYSIQTNESDLYSNIVDELSRRSLSTDAPWWHNDPLLFGLVLGGVKFKERQDWIKEVLAFRSDNASGEPRAISATLNEVLHEDWNTLSAHRPLVLMARHLLGHEDGQLARETYRQVVGADFPYAQSGFLNAVYINAKTTALLILTPEPPARKQAVADVLEAVARHTRFIGWAYWSLGLFAFSVGAITLPLWVSSVTEGWLKQIFDLLTVAGIPLVSVVPVVPWFFKRKQIISSVQRWAARNDFGYDIDVLGDLQVTNGSVK